MLEPHVPHKWRLVFNQSLVFDIFLLNIKIPKQLTGQEAHPTDIDPIEDVQIEGRDDRNCSLDFIARDGLTKIFWIWCRERDVSESTDEDMPKSLIIRFITDSSVEIKSPIGLHQVYLTRLSYCGEPPVPLLAKYNDETQRVECDDDVSYDFNEFEDPDESNPVSNQTLGDCAVDPNWAGSPKCVPKMFCKIEFNELSEALVSVNDSYAYEPNIWYAIDGTTVEFECKPGYEFEVHSVRTCLHNSSWDVEATICREIDFTLGMA